jgi:CDK inhibitor PHO81
MPIRTDTMGVAEWAYRMPDGVNGVMRANGILRFNDMIEIKQIWRGKGY